MPLLTSESIKILPPLYSTENETNPIAYIKLFTPDSNWTWYIMEYNPNDKICFGYVCGFENELGYFSMDEIESIKGSLGLGVERDTSFTPTRFLELQELHHDRNTTT